MLGSVGTVHPTPFCCAVTFILLSACLVAYTKLVMFAGATFFLAAKVCACAVESRPFVLTSDTGPLCVTLGDCAALKGLFLDVRFIIY